MSKHIDNCHSMFYVLDTTSSSKSKLFFGKLTSNYSRKKTFNLMTSQDNKSHLYLEVDEPLLPENLLF